MKFNQLGQSLLEMTIAIGVGVVVLSTMTIITLSGLKNSQFSQNQANATKLAQDGLEQVRALRDRNLDGSVCIDSTHYNWTQFWSYTCSGNSCNFTLNSSGGLCQAVGTATATPYLQPLISSGELINNRFTRVINIQDDPLGPNVKNVTSQVSWTDTAGPHQVNLSTILSNPSTQQPIY